MADSSPPASGTPDGRSVPVWDLPTRVFHWALAALVLLNIVSGKIGGNTLMEYHMLSGYAILALILFRVAWGFVGGRHARFASFVRGPGAVVRYFGQAFRGGAKWLGHNPAGGWSVLLMLALLASQAGSGLFANDDILVEGPLMKLVEKSTSDYLTWIHYLGSNALIAVIAVHVAVVVFHRIKGDDLIAAMFTGRKSNVADGPSSVPVAVGPLRAAVVAALAAGAVWALLKLP